MSRRVKEIFEDPVIIEKIQKRLPYLFHLAEFECSRAGKIGMEVGNIRERIIVALLIYKFGESNVETQIPITEAEIDTMLFREPISIKTITGSGGVKLSWTVDAQKSIEFRENYYPQFDILFAQIIWNEQGGLYYFPLEVQKKVFDKMGKENYIKLPKKGTNPRGVEISKGALVELVQDTEQKESR